MRLNDVAHTLTLWVTTSTMLSRLTAKQEMIIPIILIGLVGLVPSYLLSNLYFGELNDVPGPFFAKFTDLWRLIETWKGHYEQVVLDLHRQYGLIVRVGPRAVSIAHPDAIERIYGNKADLPKSEFYRVMQNYHNGKLVPTLLTVTDKQTHTRLRKPVNNIFAMSMVTQFEPLIDKVILELVQILREKFESKRQNCDIDQWLRYFAFDVISVLSFSQSFGFLEHGHDMHNMMEHLSFVFKYCAIIGQMPILDRLLLKNPLLRWTSLGKSPFSIRAGSLFKERITAEEKEKSTKGSDFVAHILEVKKGSPLTVPDEAVIGYIMTILLAGSDTVSVTLKSIIYYLSQNPKVQAKLQQEIDDANLTFPVSWKDAQSLPYLDAVIKEALRIHPPTSILLERVVHSNGLTLPDGRLLHAGTIASMSGWALKNNQEIFGSDAETFNPERWLPGSDESHSGFQNRVNRMKRADLAFGYGPRACLGKPIAQLEIYKLVPTLLGVFNMELARPDRQWQYLSYFVTEQYGMDVKLSWRQGVDASVLRG